MQNIYFLGIGGIGMSALARWFMHDGRGVAGYDRTRTPLTSSLASEGALIHYDDDPALIPEAFRDPATTLVIYTPAIPADSAEMAWLRHAGFETVKRSQALGALSQDKYVMAVAGTHGKTTTSTMLAWLNHVALQQPGTAFLGGISKNVGSNLSLGEGDRFVAEADEFDRSFLQLHPDVAAITSADADHLDIYGTHENLLRAFGQFVGQIKPGGSLLLHAGVDIPLNNPAIGIYRYSLQGPADFHALDISPQADGTYRFSLVCPDRVIGECHLGIPGLINVENSIVAVAMMWAAARGRKEILDAEKIKTGLDSFSGVRRRFDFHINTPELIYMDDYAHHPEELRAAIGSVRQMFPGRKLTAVFQPHLYTRTRDFYPEFASSLSLADEVIVLPVYPAREEPIEGVGPELIADMITVPHRIVTLERIAQEIEESKVDVVITFGAGDIEKYTGEIAERLRRRINKPKE